ncbi:MAG: flagellar assembly protein FliW, partial [Spirochaetales bacterium]|nr:flagellar assembly protein FliW [Spirochaetales bacterium]
LINPRVFRPDYSPGISSEDLEALGVPGEGDENLLVFSIVTIPEDQKRMTANLQGPLLINRHTRQGRQIISGDDRWHVRHLIIEEMNHAGEDTAC